MAAYGHQETPARDLPEETVPGVVCEDKGVQCDLLQAPPLECSQSSLSSTQSASSRQDSEYQPSPLMSEESEFGSSPLSERRVYPPEDETKYLVFESCLLELFATCPTCLSNCTQLVSTVGTLVTVSQTCPCCCYCRKWSSQPFIGGTPAGNLLLSAAIMFTGCTPTTTLRLFDQLGMSCFRPKTFFRHQSSSLVPVILEAWKSEQQQVVQELKALPGEAVLAADGRADSPGHCAKFGTYSVMETRLGKILDLQLVQSNEVSGSAHMEKEGLIRFVDFVVKNKIATDAIVTDRHPQIQLWIRKNWPTVRHFYDIWHIAKSIGKKIDSLARQQGCEDVGPWKKAIINHLYWCATSTPDGNGDLILAKWKSVVNHMLNLHEGHDPLYPRCLHECLDDQNILWLTPGTMAFEKLQDIVLSTTLCRDIKKLSPLHQTSSLEAFNSLLINYTPKSRAYTYLVMLSRSLLAALHFNANAGREQATTAAGSARFAIAHPKARKGESCARIVKSDPTYGYIKKLMTEVVMRVRQNPGDRPDPVKDLTIPPPLSHDKDVVKEDVVAKHMSRFPTTK